LSGGFVLLFISLGFFPVSAGWCLPEFTEGEEAVVVGIECKEIANAFAGPLI
jgi:hypothetical protein